jgi:hypothetical protein
MPLYLLSKKVQKANLTNLNVIVKIKDIRMGRSLDLLPMLPALAYDY